MIGLRLPAMRLSHALAGGVLVLAGIAAWPWLVPPVPSSRPITAPQPGAPGAALTALPPLATYAAIVERPLFSPSRRAPASVMTIGPTVESRYRLVGIFASGSKKKAYVAEGSRRIELAEGDTLDGWKVKQIGQDRVLLSSPDGEAGALKLTRITAPEPSKAQ
jgi:hypothetical protein